MKEKFLLMLLAIALVAGAAQANMLLNPSFEDGAWGLKNNPDHWEHWWTGFVPQHSWINDPNEAQSGDKYMKMYNWIPDGDSSEAYLGQTVLGVKEGGDYTFSVWAKNNAEGSTNLAVMQVEWLDSYSNWVDSGYIVIPIFDSDWIEVDFGAFTAPVGAVTADFWLIAHLDNNVNAICYDDVSMIGPDPNINAGPDLISWHGQTISLTGTTSIPGGYSTITWTADPCFGAVITGGDTLTPDVQVELIIPSGPEATIANHSFENGLTAWTLTGGWGGTWDGYAGAYYYTPADGLASAYVGSDGDGTLSQVLDNVIAANTVYTLTVDVVNDGWDEEDVEYEVQIWAGGVEQQSDGAVLGTPYGVWETETVTLTTRNGPKQLGLPIEIRLVSIDGTGEMTFDNVHLTASPDFPAHVPDMKTYQLTLDIDGKYDTMEIDVYPDGCTAKLEGGLREAQDIVGLDCMTDFPDLAEMLSTYLDDNAITEPVVGEVGADSWTVLYDFDDGTLQGWSNYEDTTGEELYVVWTGGEFEPAHTGINMIKEETWIDRDGDTFVKVLVSPPFKMVETSYVEVWSLGGVPDVDTPSWTNYADLPTVATLTGGFVGIALRRTSDGEYLLFDRRTFSGENFASYEALGWDVPTIAAAVAGDAAGEQYVVDIIDTYTTNDASPWWSWIAVDTITLVGDFVVDPMNPSPSDGAYIPPTSNLELSWTNIELDPNDPDDPNAANPIESVWIDVWFGTDPNDYNDYNRIVIQGENTTSKTVDASTLGEAYYWQVNSYMHGDPGVVGYDVYGTDANLLPVIEGTMWEFHAATDVPVSVKAGDSWLTWPGQAVQLDATVVDDGVSALTIVWSTDPAGIAVFEPSEFVEDPTVTLTPWTYSTAGIANAGFETPALVDGTWTTPPDWSYVGGGWIQTVNPGDANSNYPAYGGIAPEGNNVGISGTGGSWGGLGQVLNETLAADTEYTLTVLVGNTPTYAWVGYRVELLAGGTVLAEDDTLTPAINTFETSTVTYDSTGVDPGLLGQNLEIRLLATSNGATRVEVNFDNVQLIADPSFPRPATAPQTATLTVTVYDDSGSDEDTMTIDLYSTACMATIALDMAVFDIGDINLDCITNLADFAAIAEEWFVNNELTEPTVKP